MMKIPWQSRQNTYLGESWLSPILAWSDSYNDDPIPCYIVGDLASSFDDMALGILQVMSMMLILRQLVPGEVRLSQFKYR